MKDFEFIVTVPPDKECIENFHKELAKGLIKKHGEKTMKMVLKAIEEKER